MSCPSPYPVELRQRVVRMVAEVRPNYESDWAAITAVAQKLGIGSAETLRKWVRQAEVDGGRRAGVSTDGDVMHHRRGGRSSAPASRNTVPSTIPAPCRVSSPDSTVPSTVTRLRSLAGCPTGSPATVSVSGGNCPTGSVAGKTMSTRREVPTSVTRV